MFIRTMKALSLIAPLMLLTSVTCFAQNECNRYIAPTSRFSICIPEGWVVREKEGEKFKIFMLTGGETFNPNINFKDEVTDLQLDEYVTASVNRILANYQKRGLTSVKIVSRESFKTATGIAGIRVSFLTEYKGLLIRTLQYCFNGLENMKVIITGTALEKDKTALDSIFDGAVRTFQLSK